MRNRSAHPRTATTVQAQRRSAHGLDAVVASYIHDISARRVRRDPAVTRSQPVMRPLGAEIAGFERGRSDRVRITAHEHRERLLGLDT